MAGGYVSKLRARFLNRYRQCYYHLNLLRYNASNDWSWWKNQSREDKMTSLTGLTWRERAGYARQLFYPRVQTAVSRESHTQSAKVPFMITKQMKLDMLELGYTLRDINSLTPLEAHQIISHQLANTTHQKLETEEADSENCNQAHRASRVESACEVTPEVTPVVAPIASDTPLSKVSTSLPSQQEVLQAQLTSIRDVKSGLSSIRLKLNSATDTVSKAETSILEAIKSST